MKLRLILQPAGLFTYPNWWQVEWKCTNKCVGNVAWNTEFHGTCQKIGFLRMLVKQSRGFCSAVFQKF